MCLLLGHFKLTGAQTDSIPIPGAVGGLHFNISEEVAVPVKGFDVVAFVVVSLLLRGSVLVSLVG
jgi:hypothetical protein